MIRNFSSRVVIGKRNITVIRILTGLMLVLPMVLYPQQKASFRILCIEKPDSLGNPFAERVIELNKKRNMISSRYRFASDERKRNTIECTYDKRGRLLSKEEYTWSNYYLEKFEYKKNETIREVKYNGSNSTHQILYENNKIKSETVYLGMKSMDDTLKLGYTVHYQYNAKDSLVSMLFFRPKDTAWFEKIVRTFDKDKLIREETHSKQQQLSYRDLKYNTEGQLIEEGYWDIEHPANWEVYKYTYPDKFSKTVLRSNIYMEEWTLFVKNEIKTRKIYDITPEGVILRQWEEYREEQK